MLCTDAVTIEKPRRTADGYMVVDACIARTGIQIYAGREVGRPEMDTVRAYRAADQVFSERALKSFCHRPVTDDHPDENVTAKNWKEHAVGQTGDKAIREGDHVRVPFVLMHQDAIEAVENGKRELSCGYVCALDWTPGTTPEGESFDCQQVNITGNHLAIVARGRAGSSCRIGDAWTIPSTIEDRNMPDNLRTVFVDGLTIQTTDQGLQAIEKLQGQLKDAGLKVESKDAQLSALKSTHAGELAALKSTHDGVVAAKDSEIADLKTKIPDALVLDALLADRLQVIENSRRILGDTFDPKGKTLVDIKRAAVTAKLGDVAMKGRDDAFVGAAFDTLMLTAAAGTTPVDPIRDALRAPQPTRTADARDTAYATMVQDMENAWKHPVKGAN